MLILGFVVISILYGLLHESCNPAVRYYTGYPLHAVVFVLVFLRAYVSLRKRLLYVSQSRCDEAKEFTKNFLQGSLLCLLFEIAWLAPVFLNCELPVHLAGDLLSDATHLAGFLATLPACLIVLTSAMAGIPLNRRALRCLCPAIISTLLLSMFLCTWGYTCHRGLIMAVHGGFLRGIGRPNEALEKLNAAIELCPNRADFYLQRAWINHDLDRTKEQGSDNSKYDLADGLFESAMDRYSWAEFYETDTLARRKISQEKQ